MSFCSKCGSKFREGAKFCISCGNKRESTQIQVKEKPPTVRPLQTKTIKVSSDEAEEIATLLVFTAGALIPESDPNETLAHDEMRSIEISQEFIQKILSAFPQIGTETWIGYNEYQKINRYIQKKTIPSKTKSMETESRGSEKPPTSIPEQVDQLKTPEKRPEQIKATINGVRTVIGSLYYILFLTESRIIAAKRGRFDNLTEAGAATGGILGAVIGAGIDKVRGTKETEQEAYQRLTPDEILSQNSENFDMKYDDITSVELVKPGFWGDGEINIIESQRRFDWIFEVEKEEFQKVIDMFKKAIPDKVKVK